MSYYTLQEAADILTSHGHIMSASKLIREGAGGKVLITVPINIERSYSYSKKLRLRAAIRATIEMLKGLPESNVEFDSEQLAFLQRLHYEIMDEQRFKAMSLKDKIHELIKTNGEVDKLLHEMSQVVMCGLYIVPASNLIDFDIKGKSYLTCVFSLDGRDNFFPFVHATSEMLRITDYHLAFYKATLDQTTTTSIKPKSDTDPASAKNKTSALEEIKGRRNKQIKLITDTAIKFEYDPLSIPEGGRAKIMKECLKHPSLFTDSAFNKAWIEAGKRNLIRMRDKEKYL
ncbi:hypothetical protein [Methylobacter sp. YRD-M1]|uniref:hypothetical protein n=1 Tax=Methylobacter sp. YRD-M1 TaxID=2911520 RepID=UPI00227CCE91|nr:hypothetical protein [Methylobacter sp. YRD-M1]WAK02789.1 hypothetical protein LZ558_03090 [Methylobacter sp. YRD-M1]